MKTFISSLAIAAAFITMSACTKTYMPIPTDPNIEAPQASRQLDTNRAESVPFPRAPLRKPSVEIN